MNVHRNLRPRAKIAKSSHKLAQSTLRDIIAHGESSADDVFARSTRRTARHCTVCSCWDLVCLGLLQGHGQHETYQRGIPATYTATALGRAVAAWK